MSLHYSGGRLLLKNTTDNQWYYLEARIDAGDGLPHILVNQASGGDFDFSGHDEYAIIRADNGLAYKLGLYTNGDGVVTYRFEEAELPLTQLAVRIFIKDTTTGILYNLQGVENTEFDGQVYPRLAIAAVSTEFITTPCKAPIVASEVTSLSRCIIPAEVVINTCQKSVVLPGSNIGGTVLGGEGGEEIAGEGGNQSIGGE